MHGVKVVVLLLLPRPHHGHPGALVGVGRHRSVLQHSGVEVLGPRLESGPHFRLPEGGVDGPLGGRLVAH